MAWTATQCLTSCALAVGLLGEAMNCPAAVDSSELRKPMAEQAITLPEYFGWYAVRADGTTLMLDDPIQGLDQPPSVSLPAQVEFVVYGKDAHLDNIHLIAIPQSVPVPQGRTQTQRRAEAQKPFSWEDWLQQTQVEGPANFAAAMSGIPRGAVEVKLLAKPIAGQPQMVRLVPAQHLPSGVYQIGVMNMADNRWYRFAVGELPAGTQSRLLRMRCSQYLQTMDSACARFIADHNGERPKALQELVPAYLPTLPHCGAGGTYSIDSSVSCSIAGHSRDIDSAQSGAAQVVNTVTTYEVDPNHPAVRNFSETSVGWRKTRLYKSYVTLSDVALKPVLDAIESHVKSRRDFEVMRVDADKAKMALGYPAKRWQYEFSIALAKEDANAANGAVRMELSAQPLLGAQLSKNDIIKIFAELMEAASRKQERSPPETQKEVDPDRPISRVCPGGRIGEFTHGAECTGYYSAGKLVDIQLVGHSTTKTYDETKTLVHPGVDIVAIAGDPIYPIRDGKVIDVISGTSDRDWMNLGYMVILEHPEAGSLPKMYSTYLHLRKAPEVTTGSAVLAGVTKLGEVGATGAAFGNHVHLEVRRFRERYHSQWRSIYGKIAPEAEKTFNQATFATDWIDPSSL